MEKREPEQEIPRMEEGIEELEEHIKRSEGAVQRRREVVGEDVAGDGDETHDEAGGDDPEGAGQ